MTSAIDPMCGMTVQTAYAHFTVDDHGGTFSFCAPGCKQAFEHDPPSYVQQKQQAPFPLASLFICSGCQQRQPSTSGREQRR